MSDVFISYSRKDAAFVHHLFDVLSATGREAWVDWQGIDYSTRWWEEICEGIEQADNFVFIISPDALRSENCHREIQHARQHNKRFIPIMYREIDEREIVGDWYQQRWELLARANWDYLKSVQYLLFRDQDDFDTAFRSLTATVDIDPNYVKTHTRLIRWAREWEKQARNPSFLLRGDDLTFAEQWLAESGVRSPQPTELQRDYIASSRSIEDELRQQAEAQEHRTQALEAQTKAAAQENQQLGRRSRQFRLASAILAIVGVIALVATFAAVTQGNEARQQVGQAQEQIATIGTQVSVLAGTLTPVPQTLTPAGLTLAAGNRQVATSQEQVVALGQTLTPVAQQLQAQREIVTQIGQTLTSVAPTLTSVNHQITVSQQQIESLRLSVLANTILGSGGNAETATLLGIRALKIAYTTLADEGLTRAIPQLFTKSVLPGHDLPIFSAALSSDNQYVLTGSQDGVVQMWEATTSKMVRQFFGLDWVRKVAFSPDGQTVLGAGATVVRLWDVNTGEEIWTIDLDADYATSAAFSPDGHEIVASSGNGQLMLLDASSGKQIWQVAADPVRVNAVAFSPDGKSIATGSQDQSLVLWDALTGKKVRQFMDHSDNVQSVAFSPDGQTLLSGNLSDTAVLWNIASGAMIRQFAGGLAVAFAPDGKALYLANSANNVRMVDTETGDQVVLFSGHTAPITSISVSAGGCYLVTASEDTSARFWVFPGCPGIPRQFSGHSDTITAIAFTSDGHAFVTGSHDTSARLWDVVTQQEIRRFTDKNAVSVQVLALSHDDHFLLTGGADGSARLWDVATGEELRQFHSSGSSVLGVAFSLDSRYALTATNDHVVRLWNVATGEEIHDFSGPDSLTYPVAFSPDGHSIITGSMDKPDIILWDIKTGQEVQRFVGHTDGIYAAAFSPDGRYLVSGSSDTTIRLWDAASGKEIRHFFGSQFRINGVAFSADGSRILSTSADGTVRLWDVKTGVEIRQLHPQEVLPVVAALSPDGRFIAAAGVDNIVRLFDSDYHDFIADACRRVFHDFTSDERQQYGITDDQPTCSQFAQGAVSPAVVTPSFADDATVLKIDSSATRIFGPDSGSLIENTEDGTITWEFTRVQTSDFIAEATIANPHDISTGDWDYALLFRFDDHGNYNLRISSDQTWQLYLTKDGSQQFIQEGSIPNLELSKGGANQVRLIAQGGSAQLFVNGELTTTLDLSEKLSGIAAALSTSRHEITGEAIHYKDFTIWQITAPSSTPTIDANSTVSPDAPIFGPVDGSVEHHPENKTVEWQLLNVNVRDFIAEVRLYNDRPVWDYALVFRVGNDENYRVVLDNEQNWYFYLYANGEYTLIDQGTADAINTAANGSNQLRLMVQGDEARLYINNVFITSLDVSAWKTAGPMGVATSNVEVAGGSTRYTGFTIWELSPK